MLGALGASLGIGLGVLMAMAIRSLFSTVGLDLSGQALVFQTRTFVVAYLVGDPGHHGRRLAACPAHVPDRAGAGAARRRGDARGVPAPAVRRRDGAAGGRRHLAGDRAGRRGRRQRRVVRRGRDPDDPLRRGRRQPGDQPAVPRGSAGGAGRPLRHRRQPGRPELAAQPAAHHRDRLGADDRPRAGRDHGHPRRLRQGQRRPQHRAQLPRRPGGQQHPRPAVLPLDRPADEEGQGGARRGGPALRLRRGGRPAAGDRRGRARAPSPACSGWRWSRGRWTGSAAAR